MRGQHFYHSLLRKYVILFGYLFNEIYITRESAKGVDDHDFKVPLIYGPKEKWLTRIQKEPDISRDQTFSMPRISFEIIDIQYDTQRKLNSLNRIIVPENSTPDSFKKVWQPVPYEINFELNVYAKNVTDANKIIEQILPNFTPDWTVEAYLIDEMPDFKLDIPVVQTSITQNDLYEGDFEQRRAVLWTLTFSLKSYFFGPVKENKVIKIAETNIYSGLDANSAFEQITTYPGMNANGVATTNPDNTIHWSNIEEDDDWGFIVTIENYPSEF